MFRTPYNWFRKSINDSNLRVTERFHVIFDASELSASAFSFSVFHWDSNDLRMLVKCMFPGVVGCSIAL